MSSPILGMYGLLTWSAFVPVLCNCNGDFHSNPLDVPNYHSCPYPAGRSLLAVLAFIYVYTSGINDSCRHKDSNTLVARLVYLGMFVFEHLNARGESVLAPACSREFQVFEFEEQPRRTSDFSMHHALIPRGQIEDGGMNLKICSTLLAHQDGTTSQGWYLDMLIQT